MLDQLARQLELGPAPEGVLAVGVIERDRALVTAERFLPNPFDEADGGVMYRTGDLVRWTPAGELATKSLFQSCTIVRSAMPVAVSARTRFIAADALA